MESLLARLERRFGRFAIPNVPTFVAGGMAIVFVLALTKEQFLGALTLDVARVRQGQVWRLVTYLFIPSSLSPIWMFFSVYWTWLVGRSLEQEWGAFRLNLYYLLGMVGTTVAAFITGGAVGNTWLNLSMFFAFATLFPNYSITLFFVIPIKVKWMAFLSAGFLLFSALTGDWVDRAAIAAAMVNYFVFFGEHLVGLLRRRNVEVRQAARRVAMSSTPPPSHDRTCAMCGKRQSDGADIRVCSCAKCQPSRSLCLEHARNH